MRPILLVTITWDYYMSYSNLLVIVSRRINVHVSCDLMILIFVLPWGRYI